jgi:hypothetical protein
VSEAFFILIIIERNMINSSVLLAQYCADDRGMRCVRHVARMRERRVLNRVLVGKHEENKALGRSWRRWKDNINMDVQ